MKRDVTHGEVRSRLSRPLRRCRVPLCSIVVYVRVCAWCMCVCTRARARASKDLEFRGCLDAHLAPLMTSSAAAAAAAQKMREEIGHRARETIQKIIPALHKNRVMMRSRAIFARYRHALYGTSLSLVARVRSWVTARDENGERNARAGRFFFLFSFLLTQANDDARDFTL